MLWRLAACVLSPFVLIYLTSCLIRAGPALSSLQILTRGFALLMAVYEEIHTLPLLEPCKGRTMKDSGLESPVFSLP